MERFVNSPKSGPAHALLFSPDGQQLITAGWDKMIRFWSLDGKLVRKIAAHDQPVCSLALSPDGNLLASGSSYLLTVKSRLQPAHLSGLDRLGAQRPANHHCRPEPQSARTKAVVL